MSESAPLRVMRFVRNQGWLLPQDMETFSILKGLSLPVAKLHEKYVPLMKLAIGKQKLRGKITQFSTIEDEFHEKLGTAWCSREDRRARLSKGSIILTCPNRPKARVAIDKADTKIKEFAARWGMSCVTEFSETSTKFKFTATYKFNPDLNPVLPFELEPVNEFTLDLGFTRIQVTFDVRRLAPAFSRREVYSREASQPTGAPAHRVIVFVKSADSWLPVHTGSFVDSTVGELDQLIALASSLASRSKIS